MSKGFIFTSMAISSLAAIIASGCATPQENPHYRYSSKMETQTQPSNTQYASTPYQQTGQVTQRQVAMPYPAPVPYDYVETAPSYELAGGPDMSMAQNADWDMDMVETGGQNAGNGGTLIYQEAGLQTPQTYEAQPSVAPQSQPLIQPQTQPQTELQAPRQDYSDGPAQSTDLEGPAEQTLTISGPIYMASGDYEQQSLTQRNTLIGTQYVVQEGDNVYRLSKSICATTGNIQSMNGLDAAFTIRAGEIIQLPASRC